MRLEKRKNILLISIVAIWIAYVGVISAEYYLNISSRVGRVVADRKKDVDFVLEFGANLLMKDQVDSLSERLKQSREFRMVDFYILQKKDKVLTYYNKQNNPDELNLAYSIFNNFVENEDVTYKTIQIYDYRLTVGVNTSIKSLSRVALGEQKYLILHNLSIASLLAVILFLLVYREAVSFSRLRGVVKPEPEQPLRSLSVVGPSSSPESQLNSSEPTSFECVLVRSDLSTFTLSTLGQSSHYKEILNRYYVAAHELVARYGGILCRGAGSEVLFYLKGAPKTVVPMAAACVRSLFEIAEEIEKTLPGSAGAEFKIHAGLDWGVLQLTKLDKGPSLSGLPFAGTARLLVQAQAGKSSSLAVSESAHDSLSRVCRVVVRDGDVFLVEEFFSQESILGNHKVDSCTYYRSDLNLMMVLKYLETLVEKQDDELFFRVFSDLKHIKTHLICGELEWAFTHFLEFTYRKSHDHPVAPKILSAAVSLTGNFIPHGCGSEKLTEILKLYLEFADQRVQANAVSALGDVPGNVRFLRKFIHSDNNRLSADALVVTGKQVVDKELVRRVQGLLRSSDKVHQASGRYVALKLVEHYKHHDLLYYNTNPHLKKLEELLGKAA